MSRANIFRPKAWVCTLLILHAQREGEKAKASKGHSAKNVTAEGQHFLRHPTLFTCSHTSLTLTHAQALRRPSHPHLSSPSIQLGRRFICTLPFIYISDRSIRICVNLCSRIDVHFVASPSKLLHDHYVQVLRISTPIPASPKHPRLSVNSGPLHRLLYAKLGRSRQETILPRVSSHLLRSHLSTFRLIQPLASLVTRSTVLTIPLPQLVTWSLAKHGVASRKPWDAAAVSQDLCTIRDS